MSNQECEESVGYVKTNEGFQLGSYDGAITNAMMCALDYIGTTSDACQVRSDFLRYQSISFLFVLYLSKLRLFVIITTGRFR